MVYIDLIVTRAHDESVPARLPTLLAAFLGSCFAACMAHQRSMPVVMAISVALACGVGGCLCCMSKTPDWAADSFVVPGGTVVALVGVSMNVIMTMSLEAALEWNIGWFVIGWLVYFGYGRQHSKIALPEAIPLAATL